jgi:hypothetical protein
VKLNNDQADKLNEILATDGMPVIFAIMDSIGEEWNKKVLTLHIKPERITEWALIKAEQEGVWAGIRKFKDFMEEAARRP